MEKLMGIMALSWKQPYGSLMLHGKIETRSWSTLYRGPVLICASKRPYTIDRVMDISGDTQFYRILEMAQSFSGFKDFDGNAFAVGILTNCRPMTVRDEDACFVKYVPGLFCHVYEDVKLIRPFPYKGGQKWTKVSEHNINQIEFI